jgi:ABC-2 type transport system permease protein
MNNSTATLLKPNLLAIYYLESKSQFLRMTRTLGFSIPTLLFPVMFYTFFGIIFTMSASMPTYLMVTYAVFGIMGPALFSFGVGIAIERGQGWFDIKEVSPMPASAYIVSRIVLTLIFSLIVVMLLYFMGAVFAGVELYRSQWLLIALILMLGSLPFCAIGMTLGLYLKSGSAPAFVNLIYLPMGFLSGLWLPINMFPDTMQYFANILPSYHLAQISLKVIDMDNGGNIWLHISVLLIYLIVFTYLAIAAYYKKDKNK